jgi:hypothetical protein
MKTDTLITIAIIFVTQFVVMWINIKRQFAKTEADAMKAAGRVLFIVSAIVQWLAIAYLIWRGVLQFIDNAPMTARDVVWMLVAAFVIFQSYMILVFYLLYGRPMQIMHRGMMKHLKITDAMLYDIEKLQKK